MAIDRIGSAPNYGRDGRIAQRLRRRWDNGMLTHCSAQVRNWRNDKPWAAWRKIGSCQVTDYGRLLVEGRF